MAAVASVEQNLPTKIKSTVLYNCCIKVLANKGNRNTKIPFPIDPCVKLCCFIFISPILDDKQHNDLLILILIAVFHFYKFPSNDCNDF